MELQKYLTTKEFADAFKCSPITARKNLCLTGHCFGIRPVKLGGRAARLLWPAAEVAKLLNGEAAA